MSAMAGTEAIARKAMEGIDPSLVDSFATVIRFFSDHPTEAPTLRGKGAPSKGSAAYLQRLAASFALSRQPRAPKPPATVPDELVSVILKEYFDVPAGELDKAKQQHLLSMGAENLIGDLLERYLATILEQHEWVWCSGSLVRAADFIKPPAKSSGKWRLLQVKNRDNSENSSSSAIRLGTDIEHWFRTFSATGGSNWGAFPEESLRSQFSEEKFKTFVRQYLHKLRG
jgi:SinI restriction endonuclease